MMSTQVIEFDEECQACRGTGLYQGVAERDGGAVVCYKCKGTGCYHFRHEYQPFEARRERLGVKQVVKYNPGIVIGLGGGLALKDFGGMSYEEWANNKPFPPGSEMRRCTCPTWWYQGADYEKKPYWRDGEVQCVLAGITFPSCRYFGVKHLCWARWDREYGANGVEVA